jgi:UDP-N-acetylglucosamine 2-epimerase (non-hydrolysing)
MNRRLEERRTPIVHASATLGRKRACVVIGTRPEAIKMAPVITELERPSSGFDTVIVATAQHREMLAQAMATFGLRPHVDLGLMAARQVLSDFTSRALLALSSCFTELRPDVVLVQGDTTTVLAAALASRYLSIPVGHVEAGLRSGNIENPFPEELNRRMASVIADLHFAPTESARKNLLREGIADERIFVTGNTIVDALRRIPRRAGFDDARLNSLPWSSHRIVLTTVHRRESIGTPLENMCRGFRTVVREHPDTVVVLPVHLNPRVRDIVRQELGGEERIELLDPLSYPDLLEVARRSTFVMTDSGGIQEECLSLRKPVLVLRDTTERPEVIESGYGRLVGTNTEAVVFAASRLLDHPSVLATMVNGENPFGDGFAAVRIVQALKQWAAHREHTNGAASPMGVEGATHASSMPVALVRQWDG